MIFHSSNFPFCQCRLTRFPREETRSRHKDAKAHIKLQAKNNVFVVIYHWYSTRRLALCNYFANSIYTTGPRIYLGHNKTRLTIVTSIRFICYFPLKDSYHEVHNSKTEKTHLMHYYLTTIQLNPYAIHFSCQ